MRSPVLEETLQRKSLDSGVSLRAEGQKDRESVEDFACPCSQPQPCSIATRTRGSGLNAPNRLVPNKLPILAFGAMPCSSFITILTEHNLYKSML